MASTQPVLLKKYGNRRLYDTDKSAYVTVADVADMVRAGIEIRVVDAKTNEDLTRTVLLQIIMEHQKSRIELLPIAFLRQIITYREDTLREFFDKYLETSLAAFASAETHVAKRFRDGFETFLGGMVGGAARAWPFAGLSGAGLTGSGLAGDKKAGPAAAAPPEPEPEAPPAPANPASAHDKLLSRLEDLERRLAERERQQDEDDKPAPKRKAKR